MLMLHLGQDICCDSGFLNRDNIAHMLLAHCLSGGVTCYHKLYKDPIFQMSTMGTDDSIVGVCQYMCPESEIREREKALLIHFFERSENQPSHNEGGKAQNNWRGRGKQREVVKADKEKAVKAYTRPAAGVDKSKPKDLRPPPVLKKTVAYLCIKILVRTDVPFIEVYDFVFDRLRAVRQDMVIQRIADKSAIDILEAIVKFHLYSEYKFRQNAPRSYDPCINQKHLRDCLKTLLSLYELNNCRGETRPFFEALYCITSPLSYEVISRAFAIRHEMEDNPVFAEALKMCLSIQNRNFFKFFQLLNELPPLLAAFAVRQVSFMRTYALKAISFSYGVQTCKVPLEWIEEILCYPTPMRAEKDMHKLGCQVIQSEDDGDKFIKFVKSTPILKADNDDLMVDTEVKLTILCGLSNTEVVVVEQICPWGRDLLC